MAGVSRSPAARKQPTPYLAVLKLVIDGAFVKDPELNIARGCVEVAGDAGEICVATLTDHKGPLLGIIPSDFHRLPNWILTPEGFLESWWAIRLPPGEYEEERLRHIALRVQAELEAEQKIAAELGLAAAEAELKEETPEVGTKMAEAPKEETSETKAAKEETPEPKLLEAEVAELEAPPKEEAAKEETEEARQEREEARRKWLEALGPGVEAGNRQPWYRFYKVKIDGRKLLRAFHGVGKKMFADQGHKMEEHTLYQERILEHNGEDVIFERLSDEVYIPLDQTEKNYQMIWAAAGPATPRSFNLFNPLSWLSWWTDTLATNQYMVSEHMMNQALAKFRPHYTFSSAVWRYNRRHFKHIPLRKQQDIDDYPWSLPKPKARARPAEPIQSFGNALISRTEYEKSRLEYLFSSATDDNKNPPKP